MHIRCGWFVAREKGALNDETALKVSVGGNGKCKWGAFVENDV